MDDYFGSPTAVPEQTEMVHAVELRLARAYGEKSATKSRGVGAAGAKPTLADDVTTGGETEAK